MDGALGDIFYGQNWEAEPVGFLRLRVWACRTRAAEAATKGVDADDEVAVTV